MNLKKRVFFPIVTLVFLLGCESDQPALRFHEQGRDAPEFLSERAYQYIEEQMAFGPRVPNTQAHRDVKEYFRAHFRNTAGGQAVFVQEFQQEVYGDTLTLFNVLASFGLQHRDRIVLAAHWDSRPRADEDSLRTEEAITGADDGGSGVGVLMEFANIFAEHPLPVGVDIILFDGEDYGEKSDLDHYFLGSRHWSRNPPVPGYNPRFGILLDMVAGENAVFPREGYSMNFAPGLVDEIWAIGEEMGYGDLFLDEQGAMIADDHVTVQRETGIPMIDIIHHRVSDSGSVQFPPYWHTHRDNMEIIDREVLQAAGDVLLELIYNRIPVRSEGN